MVISCYLKYPFPTLSIFVLFEYPIVESDALWSVMYSIGSEFFYLEIQDFYESSVELKSIL